MTSPTHARQPEMLMDEAPQQLVLDSRLDDLARLSPWVEVVANRCGFEERLRFALHLCVEEALANIVLHGYRGEPGHPILVAFEITGSTLLLTIEDEAPPFVPPDELQPSASDRLVDLDSIEPGGNGLRLLRHFAGSLEYERTERGNRLTIGFPLQ